MKQSRFLVMRGGAIGDFVLTLPAFQALRKRWPDSHIEVVGYPHIARLALAAGLVDEVASLDKSEMARFFSLRPSFSDAQLEYVRSFDCILSYLYDPGGTVRENLLAAGAKRVIHGSPMVTDVHACDHLFLPMSELAIYSDEQELPRLQFSPEHVENGRSRIARFGGKVFAIHPGSGDPGKNWPLGNFLQVADYVKRETDMTPVFILGEADSEIRAQLAAERRDLSVLSDCSLLEIAEALSASCAFVGNDSGVTHVAAALGLPVVTLFGPSDHTVWGARGENVRVVPSDERSSSSLAALPVATVLDVLRAHSRDLAKHSGQ